jgi:GH25 family lysozyme M1 (1,4-beta-N-acetylmuramidase)
LKGFDISQWQGKHSLEDFKRAKNAGYDFVILRIAHTHNTVIQKDPCFENNYNNAIKAGFYVGIYFYSTAKTVTKSKLEAEFTLRYLKDRKLHLPIFFDCEDKKQRGLGKTKLKNVCEGFCNVIEKAGYDAGVYANKSFLVSEIATISKEYNIWLAEWRVKPNHPTYKKRYELHQYSSTGSVTGFGHPIDMDVSKLKPSKKPTFEKAQSVKKKSGYMGTFPRLPKKRYFEKGDTGQEVKYLQEFLNWYGDYDLEIDGSYGNLTRNAVKDYQRKENLEVDGFFGKESITHAKKYKR